jgi:hypothetical protein
MFSAMTIAKKDVRNLRFPGQEGCAAMLCYQFHYLNNKRLLACLVLMNCHDDEEAMNRACSLRGIAHDRIEIWRGETKVFETAHA